MAQSRRILASVGKTKVQSLEWGRSNSSGVCVCVCVCVCVHACVFDHPFLMFFEMRSPYLPM